MSEDRLSELIAIVEGVKRTGQYDEVEALAAAKRAGIVTPDHPLLCPCVRGRPDECWGLR